MSEPAYRIKIHGELHELPQLTLGQARLLREHFDIRDLSDMQPGDPNVIAGLAYLCVARANLDWEHMRVMNYVDDLALDAFEPADEVSADPNAVPAGG
ncbi:MAG: hypothetical protein Q8O56_12840 [Solirubrobacteraceae bacterium]|nr:hypothetical protein [Solirubrobacteraceae bacterium]